MIVNDKCGARLSVFPDRVNEVVGEIKKILARKEAFLAQAQKLVRKLITAQTSLVEKIGRAALRQLYDLITKGGGRIGKRSRWALEWWLKLLPVATASVIRPISSAVDVRIYSCS